MAERFPDTFRDNNDASDRISEGLGQSTQLRREAMDAKVLQDREASLAARELWDIDQTINQVKYIREHLVELTAGMNQTRVYRNQVNGKYHYFVNEPPRVVIDQRNTADTVLVEPVDDLLAELRMLEARKTAIINKLNTISAEMRAKRDAFEIEERKMHENQDKDKQTHEDETHNLRDAIAEAKRMGNTEIFSLHGRYYPTDPARVSTNGDLSDSLYVHTITLERAKQRLEEIDIPTTKTQFIHSLDATIDKLAQAPKDGANAPNVATREFRENLRKVLVNVRLGVSDFPQLSTGAFDGINEASAVQRLTKLADTNIEDIDLNTMLTTVEDLIHVSRYGISDSVAVLIGTVRSLTSNRIYQMGEEPEAGTERISWFSQSTRAKTAGAIDGMLDYSQAFVDTIVVPDKIMHNAKDICVSIEQDGNEFFSGLKTLLADNLKTPANQDYCVAYVVSVIACMCVMPNPLTVATIPAVIMKAVARLLSKIWATLDAATSWKIAELIAKSHITDTIGTYAQKWTHGTEEVVAQGSDKIDTASTGTQRLKDLAEEARLAKANMLLKSITDTTILTNIFGDKIRANVWAWDPKTMTDNAMEIYLQTLGKDAGYEGTEQLKDAIAKTKGDTQYQLVRVFERYAEVREIMEREVMPVVVETRTLRVDDDDKERQYYKRSLKQKLPTMSELGRQIIEKYYMRP